MPAAVSVDSKNWQAGSVFLLVYHVVRNHRRTVWKSLLLLSTSHGADDSAQTLVQVG